jgi:hypothetical protein
VGPLFIAGPPPSCCSQNGYLSSRSGCPNRWHSLVGCDHGDSTTSRFDSPGSCCEYPARLRPPPKIIRGRCGAAAAGCAAEEEARCCCCCCWRGRAYHPLHVRYRPRLYWGGATAAAAAAAAKGATALRGCGADARSWSWRAGSIVNIFLPRARVAHVNPSQNPTQIKG